MIIENYYYLLAFLGVAFLGLTVLPIYLEKSFLSIPMVYIGLGFLISFIFKGLPHFDPLEHNFLVEKTTEITVIISLMGAGLKLDKPLQWKVWSPTIRLLFITMPIFIFLIAILGNIWMGLSFGAAILLGSVLAPTDPVLAGDVQVSSPQSGKVDSKVRFTLTSEAGLNDGLAFPFVFLAGFLVTKGLSGEMLLDWFSYEFLYKIVVGILVGYLCGKAVGYFLFEIKRNVKFDDGFVAIALTLFTYGISEIVHGYGFIAVFVAGYFFRHTEINHEYHKELHDFAEQIEKLLVGILLLIFGVAIGDGLLNYLTWQSIIIGLVIVLILRPMIGYFSLIKTGLNHKEKLIISFLGIKGIGSFYYLAFGLQHFEFQTIDVRLIWSLVAFVILVSVLIHGISAPFVMRKHERTIKKSI